LSARVPRRVAARRDASRGSTIASATAIIAATVSQNTVWRFVHLRMQGRSELSAAAEKKGGRSPP